MNDKLSEKEVVLAKDEQVGIREKCELIGLRLKEKGFFKTDAEIKLWENHCMSRQIVKKAVNEVKDIIVKQPQQDQLLFSFMPTQMTRTTPFFPISKKAMKDRPHEVLEWETSWGQIVLSGERLSVYDETILLNLLFLVKKQRSEVLETTQYQLCKLSNVKPATNTYNAIWESLKRLSLTNIELSIWEGKGTQRKPSIEMSGTIITWIKRDRKKGKLQIALNPYFNEMYAESFVTNINLEYRANLKGDVSKSIYRFLEGQSNKNYSIHILKLAAAINLNINMSMNELRKTIRKGLRELKDKGYLTRWILQSKNDIVSVWKSNLKLLNN